MIFARFAPVGLKWSLCSTAFFPEAWKGQPSLVLRIDHDVLTTIMGLSGQGYQNRKFIQQFILKSLRRPMKTFIT